MNWKAYLKAKSDSKKLVAAARSVHYKAIYDRLDTQEGECDLYRFIKRQHQQTQDIGKLHRVNDVNGKLLIDRKVVTG